MGILEDIKDLWNRLTSLEWWINYLEAWIEAEIKRLQRDINATLGVIDALKAEMDEHIIARIKEILKTDIGDVWSVLDTIRSDIANTANRLSETAKNVLDLKASIEALPQKVVGLVIDKIVDDFEALAFRVLNTQIPEPIFMTSVLDVEIQKRLAEHRRFKNVSK